MPSCLKKHAELDFSRLYYMGFLRDGIEEGALPEEGQPGM